MKSFLSKLKTAIGKPNASKVLNDDSYIEGIINSIEQPPFAVSDENVCYASSNELAGYYYLQTIIVGKFKIKTFNGAQLLIKGHDFELELESEMMELESELSNVPKSYMTRIDFVLDEKDVPKINKSKINSLKLSAKKQSVAFTIIVQSNDEEE